MSTKRVVKFFCGLCVLLLVACDGAEDREAKYLNKAENYFKAKNFEKMRVELKNVLQINPKNIEARYLMALDAEKHQEWRKMFSSLSMVVEANPQHYEAQNKLGKLFLFSKDLEKAKEKSDFILAAEPQNTEAMALKATIAMAENKKDEALTILKDVLVLEPGHLDATLLSVQMLSKTNNLEEAKTIVDQALSVHPENLRLSLVKANMLLVEKKDVEAENIYKALIVKNSQNENIYYQLIKLYIAKKDIDAAEDLLKSLVRTQPENDKAKFVLIEFLKRERGTAQTEKEIDRLIAENPENYGFRFAKLAVYKDQPEKLEMVLKGIIEDDKYGSAGVDARNKLAVFYQQKNESDKAKVLINEIIEIDSRNAPALLFRAGLYLKEKEYEAALADARTVTKDNPESEKALMILAMAQLRSDNVELAQETLEKLLVINPKNKLAAMDLARIKVYGKDQEGAIELLEKHHGLDKQDQQISMMLTDLYGKAKEWDKAEALTKSLIKEGEKKYRYHYKLAQLYIGQEKFVQAIAELKKVLQETPLDSNVLAGLINSYYAIDKGEEAEKLIDGLISENKENPALLTMRAQMHKKQKQYIEAERMFKEVLNLSPKAEIAYINLASVYLSQKKIDEALTVFQRGAVALPDNKNIMLQLAVINTLKGDDTAAIAAYEGLFKKEPDNLLVRNNLANLVLKDPSQLDKAIKLIEPLKDSDQPAFQDTYGWVNYKKGNMDVALSALESAVLNENTIPEMHYHMAMVYIHFGRNEEAKRQLERALVEGADYFGIETAQEQFKKLSQNNI